eukprot:COSAG01_NODE_2902_length_6891_cov_3.810218_3_plen_153_part_00
MQTTTWIKSWGVGIVLHAHPLLVRTRMASVAVAVAGRLPDYRMGGARVVVATADGWNTQAALVLRQQEHAVSRGVVPRLASSADTRLHAFAEPRREIRWPPVSKTKNKQDTPHHPAWHRQRYFTHDNKHQKTARRVHLSEHLSSRIRCASSY